MPTPQTSPPLPALTVYQDHGCTLAAFKQALQHGIAHKEKDLAKSFSRQLFQAAGTDPFRVRLQNQAELQSLLSLALALVNKNDKPADWLDMLEQPDYWNATRLTAISALLNKATTRLATHIPKTRNPANEGAPRFCKQACGDLSAIAASEASLATATIEGDATLVGARFFFELAFYWQGQPTSVMALLLDKDPRLTIALQALGMDDGTIGRWQNEAQRQPVQLSPLQAQVLLSDANGEWLSISPVFSVAACSWLGQWRKEGYSSGQESPRPLFDIEAAEYGGTNARNIAAVMMDFSGRQQHPKILPPPVKRDYLGRLQRLIHRPAALIQANMLHGKELAALSNPYTDLPIQRITQKLSVHIRQLLDDLLEDITLCKSLLDSQHEDALNFQTAFADISPKHPHLSLLLGTADGQQLAIIANSITQKWLGPFDKFAGRGDRYEKIQALVLDSLQAYQLEAQA